MIIFDNQKPIFEKINLALETKVLKHVLIETIDFQLSCSFNEPIFGERIFRHLQNKSSSIIK